MISIWILVGIIGIISLVFGIPQVVDGELLGVILVPLGIVSTAIGIGMIVYSCL